MAVLIPRPVPHPPHQPRHGVPQMQRHGFIGTAPHLRQRPFQPDVGGVALRRRRQIHRRLRQRNPPLRQPDKMRRLLRRHRHRQRPRIRQPDVLRRQYHQPPRYEQRILPRLQHPRQPVQRPVRRRPPHRLDERRYGVIMAVPRLVVLRRAPLQGIGYGVNPNAPPAAGPGVGFRSIFRFGAHRRHLQGVQRHPRVAVGNVHQMRPRLIVQLRRQHPQPPPLVRQRPPDDVRHRPIIQGIQREHPTAGKQRGVDLKRRVFGGSPDESDRAVLNIGQNDILLRLVETMDLVHKQDGRLPVQRLPFPRPGHRLPQVRHARRHCAHRLKMRLRRGRNQPRQRRLPRTGRPPEQYRRHPVGRNRPPQRPVRPQNMLLSHKLGERRRPHPFRQRRRLQGALPAAVLKKSRRIFTGGSHNRIAPCDSDNIGGGASRLLGAAYPRLSASAPLYPAVPPPSTAPAPAPARPAAQNV